MSNAERAAALLDPMRLRILQSLGEGESSTSLAKKLELPRQKVNYHLRELERAQAVELVEERRRGNCVERIVRAVARSFVIDPRVLGTLAADPERVEDRTSSAYLVAVAARMIRDLATLRQRADAVGKKLTTMTVQTRVRFAGIEQQVAFANDLANAVARLVAKYHDESAAGGRSFELAAGLYPTITKSDEEATAELLALAGKRAIELSKPPPPAEPKKQKKKRRKKRATDVADGQARGSWFGSGR